MGGDKVDVSFQVNPDQVDWLKDMAAHYDLEDEHKALRVLIDFAMEDGDKKLIFESTRCRRC